MLGDISNDATLAFNRGDLFTYSGVISGSGNSPNVLRAAEVAREKNMHVIGLTGKDGGRLADLCTVEVRVPHQGYADRVQEVHIKVIHALIDHIERDLAQPRRKEH